MMMKNIIISLFVAILVAGCASSGYGVANHNGKTYWFPSSCPYYQYYNDNPDILHCVTQSNQKTGQKLYPASQADVQNYHSQQQLQLQQQQIYNQQTQNYYMQQQNQQLQNMNNQIMLQNFQQYSNGNRWYR
jgi:hypothetical protein